MATQRVKGVALPLKKPSNGLTPPIKQGKSQPFKAATKGGSPPKAKGMGEKHKGGSA